MCVFEKSRWGREGEGGGSTLARRRGARGWPRGDANAHATPPRAGGQQSPSTRWGGRIGGVLFLCAHACVCGRIPGQRLRLVAGGRVVFAIGQHCGATVKVEDRRAAGRGEAVGRERVRSRGCARGAQLGGREVEEGGGAHRQRITGAPRWGGPRKSGQKGRRREGIIKNEGGKGTPTPRWGGVRRGEGGAIDDREGRGRAVKVWREACEENTRGGQERGKAERGARL